MRKDIGMGKNVLDWVKPFEIDVETEIMPEHRDLYKKLLVHLQKIIK